MECSSVKFSLTRQNFLKSRKTCFQPPQQEDRWETLRIRVPGRIFVVHFHLRPGSVFVVTVAVALAGLHFFSTVFFFFSSAQSSGAYKSVTHLSMSTCSSSSFVFQQLGKEYKNGGKRVNRIDVFTIIPFAFLFIF